MVVGARRALTSKLKNRQPEDGLSGRRVGGEKSDVTADAQCDKPSLTLQVARGLEVAIRQSKFR
jgi:hypothetical protein